MESIIIKIIDLMITFAANPLKKDYHIGKLLKQMGLLKLEANFDSRFIHALIEFGKNNSNHKFIEILSNKELRELFQIGITNNNIEKFREKADFLLYEKLAIENITLDKQNEEIIQDFVTTYETIDKQTESKVLLDYINQNKLQMQELIENNYKLLEDNYKNSFDYRITKYKEQLIKKFP